MEYIEDLAHQIHDLMGSMLATIIVGVFLSVYAFTVFVLAGLLIGLLINI